MEPDGSDAWRLDDVAERIKQGQVGILPTDTYPAFVVDVENRKAVELMYRIKDIDPHKPCTLLCRNFADVALYTNGWPMNDVQGDLFRVAKRALPGPYTFLLGASKRLPAQVVDFESKKTRRRNEVGVRIPGDPVTQALLERLDRPLLCTSVHVEKALTEDEFGNGDWLIDVAGLGRYYGPRGLGFVVSSGVATLEGSTVIDLVSAKMPKLLRQGKGDPSLFTFGEDEGAATAEEEEGVPMEVPKGKKPLPEALRRGVHAYQ